MAEHFLQTVERNSPGPKDDRAVTREINDRRFHTNTTRPTIKHDFNIVAKIGHDMRCRRGADSAKSIGRRRSNASTESTKQFQRDRMIGNPESNC
jgi:hypothetical protein